MPYLTLSRDKRLYYEEIGAGPETVVFLHGWTSSRKIFQRPAKLLRDRTRCILVDQRGHENSRSCGGDHVTMETLAEDLHTLLTTLDLHRVTLVGWSMGAGVAMTYVGRCGCARLRQLVLCDMTPRQLNDEDWHLGLNRGRYTRQDMERDMGKDFLDLFFNFSCEAVPTLKSIPAGVLRLILRRRLSHSDEDVLRSLSASMKTQDNRQAVTQITVPLTYFYAQPGTLFSEELADWYRETVRVPFRAVAFPGCTHLLVSDAPDLFAQRIMELL